MNLSNYLEKIESNFDSISLARINTLSEISNLLVANQNINVLFVCTHNSRRSQFSQVWFSIGCAYYDIAGHNAYSGGTEVTACNERTIEALKKTGLQISSEGEQNPRYSIMSDLNDQEIIAYSKTIDDPSNPHENFLAIMTCDEADENCPFVPGAKKRIKLLYDDPKVFDDTELEEKKYAERCFEIATEIFWVLKNVKNS
jgi:arsenate reductase